MIRRLFRDWRFRTLLPILLIHTAAFGGIYLLVYRLATGEAMEAHRSAATIILNEVDIECRNIMATHDRSSVRQMILDQARDHESVQLSLYDGRGRLLARSHVQASPLHGGEDLRRGLEGDDHRTYWSLADGDRVALVGLRVLRNEPVCHKCHDSAMKNVGAIEMTFDITAPMKATRSRLRVTLGLLVLIWGGLVFAMLRLRDRVIGRPLARIDGTIRGNRDREAPKSPRDLDAMADRVDAQVWQMIDSQRRREQSISKGMARAEQLAALGELAAGLTHEIRNPLAGITAAVEVLRSEERGGTKEHESVYEQILAELARVNGTVDGLLRLGRPQVPQRVQVDLGRVVRDVSDLFEARLKTRRVSLSVEVQRGLPVLPLDPGMMTQLLVNLLTNSLDAVEADGKIGILVGPFPKGDGVALIVSDTGKGIAPEDLDRVFDTFFTTKEHGTGLGLSICRQIVEQHGGTINVESGPGGGAKVMVLLPAREPGDAIS